MSVCEEGALAKKVNSYGTHRVGRAHIQYAAAFIYMYAR